MSLPASVWKQILDRLDSIDSNTRKIAGVGDVEQLLGGIRQLAPLIPVEPLLPRNIGPYLIPFITSSASAATSITIAVTKSPALTSAGLIGDETISVRWISIEAIPGAAQKVDSINVDVQFPSRPDLATSFFLRKSQEYALSGVGIQMLLTKELDVPLDLNDPVYGAGGTVIQATGVFNAGAASNTLRIYAVIEVLRRKK